MKLSDIKTLKDISFLYNIPITTLKTRIASQNIGLIENEDYRKMGQGQGIIFSSAGVSKITKNEEEVLNRELIEQNGIYKLFKVITKTKTKYEFCENYTLCLTQEDSNLESALEIWAYFKSCGTIII